MIGYLAFHPEVSYNYVFGGIAYSGTSGLNSPGFGGKRNRLELAESLVSEFPPGRPLHVHYNPADPSVSVLTPGITYTTGFQVAFGVILLAAAAFSPLYRPAGNDLKRINRYKSGTDRLCDR